MALNDVPISDFQRLTELLAAHGVYALTVLVIFYLNRLAKQNLDKADGSDHDYFRRIHASTWTATWVMIIVCTAAWLYGNYVYKPVSPFVRGSVMALADQPMTPSKAGDPDELSETIEPASRDFDLYASRVRNDTTHTYDLDWLLVPRDNALPNSIPFTFQHHYARWKPQNAALALVTDTTRSLVEADTVLRTFTIDLGRLNHPGARSLQIAYEKDASDPLHKIGKLYLRLDDGKKMPIDWEQQAASITPVPALAALRQWLFPGLAAASAPMFDANGHYDPQAGRFLRRQLASADLKQQLAATAILVDAKQRAFTFIRDSLSATESSPDRALLIANISRALESIEQSGTPAPPDLKFQVALAYSSLQNFGAASKFFDRAGDGPISNPAQLLTRGYSYQQAEQHDKAIRDFDRYLQSPVATGKGKALAQTYVALSYEGQHKTPQAIERYRAAIAVDPTFSMAYNNLAYLYASQGENLAEALKLASKALELNRDSDDQALYQDTKGWVLYKSGHYQEAAALLKEAARQAPNELEIKEHLAQAQKKAEGR